MTKEVTKDTIYIDVEDEITAIIDKLQHSEAKIVALVLPKRSAALQSVVNLKLLKRSAGNAKKNIVLITSDATLLPMAGAVGLHVAKTLQSKPVIPEPPKPAEADITIDSDTSDSSDEDSSIDPKTPIGVLAGAAALAAEETIDVDNETKKEQTPKTKDIGGKFKIPDFNKFRMKLFAAAGVLVVFLIVFVFGSVVLPRAKITITTDSTKSAVDLSITADTAQKTVDTAHLILPASKKTSDQSTSQKVAATGTKNDGNKATGTMTIFNCSSQVVDLPAGTVFSSGSKKFLSDEAVSVPKSSYSFTLGGFVCDKNGFRNVAVTAQSGGESYNLDASSYTIQGGPSNVTASGSSMSGGTDKLIKVVSQTDLDNAKQSALDKLKPEATDDLKQQFSDAGEVAIADTLTNTTPKVTSSPKVNEAADSVTVNVSTTYSQLGVKQEDLKKLVEDQVSKHIDTTKQVVQDTGLDQAVIKVTKKISSDKVTVNIQSTALTGPDLNEDTIKQMVAGKKKGDTQDLILARPGIKAVTVHYSPFWVFSTPKKLSHITIKFEENNDITP